MNDSETNENINSEKFIRDNISDEINLSCTEIEDYNNFIKKYLGNKVSGTDIKTLITYIKTHNQNQHKNNEDNYLRLLIHLDENYTKNKQSYYLLTGINSVNIKSPDYLSEYIEAIKDEEFYYVKVHEYNSNGNIYKIVISDDITKYNYQ